MAQRFNKKGNYQSTYQPRKFQQREKNEVGEWINKFASDKDVKMLEVRLMECLKKDPSNTAKEIMKNALWEVLYENGPILKFLKDEFSDAKQTYPLICYVNWPRKNPLFSRTDVDLLKTAQIVKKHINKSIMRKNGDAESVVQSLISASKSTLGKDGKIVASAIDSKQFDTLYNFYTEGSDNLIILHEFISKLILTKDNREKSGHQNYPDIPRHRFFKDYVLMVLKTYKADVAIQFLVRSLFIQLTNAKVNACVQQYWDRIAKKTTDEEHNKKEKDDERRQKEDEKKGKFRPTKERVYYIVEDVNPKENGRYKIVDTLLDILSWVLTTGPEKEGELSLFFKKHNYDAKIFAPQFFNSLQESFCKIDIGKFKDDNDKLEKITEIEKKDTKLQFHNINTIGAIIGGIGFNDRVRKWINMWNQKCPDAVLSCIKHALDINPAHNQELVKLIPNTNTMSRLMQSIASEIVNEKKLVSQQDIKQEIKQEMTQEIELENYCSYIPPELTELIKLNSLDKVQKFDISNSIIDDAIYSLTKLKKEKQVDEKEWCEVLLNASMTLKKEATTIFVQIVPHVADSKVFSAILKNKGESIVESYKIDNPNCTLIYKIMLESFQETEEVNWNFATKQPVKKQKEKSKIGRVKVTIKQSPQNLFDVLGEDDN
jgi:hypothetical protein